MGYVHRGEVQANGFVDTTKWIRATSDLELTPSDDGFHVAPSEIGDFEWWYFDVIDTNTECILKLVAHLGTDPLRQRIYPKLAISIRTPDTKTSIVRPHELKDFVGSREYCDVRLKNELRVRVESPIDKNVYHLTVDIPEFKADLTFVPEVAGWMPLGREVKIERNERRAAFSWLIPIPKARVDGEFSLGSRKYRLEKALGYHDHNYWKVDAKKKLYIDSVITRWHWGRLLTKDCAVIFMDTWIKWPQAKASPITSLLISKQREIVHSSNNMIEVLTSGFKRDEDIRTTFPTAVTVSSVDEDLSFKMNLAAKEVIEKRDLLDEIHSVPRFLIKLFVAKPAYYGICAESTVNIGNEEQRGIALYELMAFRNR